MMVGLFQNILEIGIMAGILIIVVLLVRICFKKTTAAFRCVLWMLVGIRLLIPVNIVAPFSLVPAVEFGEVQAAVSALWRGANPAGESWTDAQEDVQAAGNREENKSGEQSAGPEISQIAAEGTGQGAAKSQGTEPGQSATVSQNGNVAQNEAHTSETDGDRDVFADAVQTLGEKDTSDNSGVYTVLTCIWLVGVFVMLGYMGISGLCLHRSLASAVPETRQFGGRRVKIYRSEHISSPFLLGIARPRIYVPFGLEEPKLQYVLAHELTHISRRDYWWKPLSFVVLSLYWFHPLVWVAYILFDRDIEGACDEQVLRKEPELEKAAYAQALLSCASRQKRIEVCPVAFGESDVKKRVKNVMSYKKPSVLVAIVCVLLGMLIALCFMTVAEGKEKILTMETLLELTEEDKLTALVEKKGLDGFTKYENLIGSKIPEGAVSATYKCDLSYEGKEYEFELYYKLPQEEGEEAEIDTIYVNYLYNNIKEAIYTVRENVEVVELREFLEHIEYTYTLDSYVTYTLPEGFSIGDIKTNSGSYTHALLNGDVEEPLHADASSEYCYAPGGIGFIRDFYPITFENGEPVSVWWTSNHSWLDPDSFEKVDGCFTFALLAEAGFDLFVPAEIEEYVSEHPGMTYEEFYEIYEPSRFWYVFICNEWSETGYVVFLNQAYFTKEDVITLARSIRPVDYEEPEILTMEGLLELARGGSLNALIEEQGMAAFTAYDNLVKPEIQEGVVSATYTCNLAYKDKAYLLEVYYRLGKEGQSDSVDTVYLSYPASGDKQVIYTIRNNIETVEAQEFVDFVDRAYSLDSYITYQLPEGFSLGEFEIFSEALINGCLLQGDVEEQPHSGTGEDYAYEYAPGGIGTITEMQRFAFENGAPVAVSYGGTHRGVVEDSFEQVEGCFTTALLAEVSFDLMTIPEQAEFLEAHPEFAGTEGLGQAVHWYVFICDEESEVGYVVYLNQKYFTKEDVLAFARSVRPIEQ